MSMQSSFDDGFDEVTITGVADGSEIVLREQDGEYDYQVNNSSEAILEVDGVKQPIDKMSTISSIELIGVDVTTYTYRLQDSIETTGMNLKVNYKDGTSETISDMSKVTFEGFDSHRIGKQTITVRYGNATTTYQVRVEYAWWQWLINIFLLGFFWY